MCVVLWDCLCLSDANVRLPHMGNQEQNNDYNNVQLCKLMNLLRVTFRNFMGAVLMLSCSPIFSWSVSKENSRPIARWRGQGGCPGPWRIKGDRCKENRRSIFAMLWGKKKIASMWGLERSLGLCSLLQVACQGCLAGARQVIHWSLGRVGEMKKLVKAHFSRQESSAQQLC